MHSAFISSRLRYRAMPLAGQLVHKWSVHPGPLVLGTAPLKSPAPTPDRDRTVSRRSEPSSRTALIGEQPNPWDLSLIHISEPTRQAEISYAVFCLKKKKKKKEKQQSRITRVNGKKKKKPVDAKKHKQT